MAKLKRNMYLEMALMMVVRIGLSTVSDFQKLSVWKSVLNLECDSARNHAFACFLTSAYHRGLHGNRGIPQGAGRPVPMGRDHPYVSQVYKVLV